MRLWVSIAISKVTGPARAASTYPIADGKVLGSIVLEGKAVQGQLTTHSLSEHFLGLNRSLESHLI